jgi:hypothetical protein
MSSRRWIGVDLDGTLAKHEHWGAEDEIGAPIGPMVERVREWLARGIEVRIFTARITHYSDAPPTRTAEVARITRAIEAWCEEHIGTALSVTNVKDYAMIELWDDRCIQVMSNTGQRVGAVSPPEHQVLDSDAVTDSTGLSI